MFCNAYQRYSIGSVSKQKNGGKVQCKQSNLEKSELLFSLFVFCLQVETTAKKLSLTHSVANEETFPFPKYLQIEPSTFSFLWLFPQPFSFSPFLLVCDSAGNKNLSGIQMLFLAPHLWNSTHFFSWKLQDQETRVKCGSICCLLSLNLGKRNRNLQTFPFFGFFLFRVRLLALNIQAKLPLWLWRPLECLRN